MSVRPPTALIFLFVLTAVLIIEQFFVGLLQIAFNDPSLNFSILSGVILFFRLLLNIGMAFIVAAGSGIGNVLGFITLDEFTNSFFALTDSILALSTFLIQVIVAIVGTVIMDRILNQNSEVWDGFDLGGLG